MSASSAVVVLNALRLRGSARAEAHEPAARRSGGPFAGESGEAHRAVRSAA
jgi:hypothetical protein